MEEKVNKPVKKYVKNGITYTIIGKPNVQLLLESINNIYEENLKNKPTNS